MSSPWESNSSASPFNSRVICSLVFPLHDCMPASIVIRLCFVITAPLSFLMHVPCHGWKTHLRDFQSRGAERIVLEQMKYGVLNF